MTSPANSDTVLLTEHFGYPPVSLIDDIINSINILAERALNSVEQGLLNAPPSSIGFKPPKPTRGKGGGGGDVAQQLNPAEAAKNEIESGTHQLETLLCASIDRNFDKLEIYVLRNIFCVRPADVRNWIRLSHYEGLDFSSISSPSANSPSLDTINHLRRKLRESMRLNALLEAERARNEKLLNELQTLVGHPDTQIKTEKPSGAGSQQSQQQQPSENAAEPNNGNETINNKKKSPFAFLHHKGTLTDGGSEAPLSTTTAFTLSQMQALRALSTSLQRLAPDLLPPPTPSHNDDDDDQDTMDIDSTTANQNNNNSKKKKSWRRERLEYVEGATKRYLESVEGLELGRHGEVRDGEWQGEGGRIPGGEVSRVGSSFALFPAEASAAPETGKGGKGRGAGTTTTAAVATAPAAAAKAAATTTPGHGRSTRSTRSMSRDVEDRMDES